MAAAPPSAADATPKDHSLLLSKVPVNVEVVARLHVEAQDAIRQHVLVFLRDCVTFREGPIQLPANHALHSYVERVSVAELGHGAGDSVSFWQADLQVHVFQLSDVEPEVDVLHSEEGGEAVAPCTQWMLPRRSHQGLWESLVLEAAVKPQLLDFAVSAMLFARHHVDEHIISWNRVILLHGPPGTGKTSLCRGLAQKLSIRMAHQYSNAVLVEIHSHSLFSKWFSESGKLVARLFEHIHELIEDETTLTCVLIDEVESLTAARSSALNGAEPSDALRVVNAMLTQLDGLKRYPNVLTLCTSNLAEAIDVAFIDRADLKLFVGNPPPVARYTILRSCVLELMRVGIIRPAVDIAASAVIPNGNSRTPNTDECTMAVDAQAPPQSLEAQLVAVACRAEGLSGRTLRKLPFLAYANHARCGGACSPAAFLAALDAAVASERRDRAGLLAAGSQGRTEQRADGARPAGAPQSPSAEMSALERAS